MFRLRTVSSVAAPRRAQAPWLGRPSAQFCGSQGTSSLISEPAGPLWYGEIKGQNFFWGMALSSNWARPPPKEDRVISGLRLECPDGGRLCSVFPCFHDFKVTKFLLDCQGKSSYCSKLAMSQLEEKLDELRTRTWVSARRSSGGHKKVSGRQAGGKQREERTATDVCEKSVAAVKKPRGRDTKRAMPCSGNRRGLSCGVCIGERRRDSSRAAVR